MSSQSSPGNPGIYCSSWCLGHTWTNYVQSWKWKTQEGHRCYRGIVMSVWAPGAQFSVLSLQRQDRITQTRGWDVSWERQAVGGGRRDGWSQAWVGLLSSCLDAWVLDSRASRESSRLGTELVRWFWAEPSSFSDGGLFKTKLQGWFRTTAVLVSDQRLCEKWPHSNRWGWRRAGSFHTRKHKHLCT